MAQVGMTVNFKTAMDITPVKNGLAEINKTVAQSPIDLKIKDTGIKTGMSKKESDAFYKEIRSGAVELEKLTIQYKMFQNVAGGPAFKVATQAIKETKDATGHLSKEMRDLNVQKIKMYEADARYKQVGMDQVVLNAGAAARKTTSDFNKMKLSLDANELSAKKFLEKSKNMSGQQVNNTKKVAEELIKQKKAFDLAFSTNNAKAMETAAQKVRDLNKEMQILRSGTDRGANAIQGWADRIGNAVKQTVAYGLSIQLVRKAQQLLNDAIKYSIELNTEMVKIQVLQAEGASSPEQIQALAQSYNNLGQAMGVSTLEIAKGSVEWLRQGRTVEETQKLLISTLQLSKLGAMDAADATNYLTAITNAFKLSADETATVVDKLIAVDNIAATSAGELATAMRYTSESAQLAGVSMEQLISYIGTVSSVTRQNAEMIGQAFKTMFARMTLMSGGGEDEFGMTISKVEKALSSIGVAVRNTNDELLPMGDILEEVAGKWDTLTDRQRTEIAVAIAGVRQKESFLVLMNNMDKAITYQAAQVDSLGLAQDRYGIYLDSVQAKQGRLKAQMEDLYTNIINSDTIKKVLDLASAFLELIDSIGGLPPILIILVGLMTVFSSQSILTGISKIGSAISTLTTAFGSLKSMIIATTIAEQGLTAAIPGIGLLIVGLGIAYGALTSAIQKDKEELENASNAMNDYVTNAGEMTDKLESAKLILIDINRLLEKQGKSSGGGLNVNDTESLYDAYKRLKEILPELDWKYDAQGRPFLDAAMDAKALEAELNSILQITKEQKTQFELVFETQSEAYESAADKIDIITGYLEVMEEAQRRVEFQGGLPALSAYLDTLNDGYGDLSEGARQAVKEIETTLSSIGSDSSEVIAENIGNSITVASQQLSTEETIANNISKGLIQLFTIGYQNSEKGITRVWFNGLKSIFGDTRLWKDLEVLMQKNMAKVPTAKAEPRGQDKRLQVQESYLLTEKEQLEISEKQRKAYESQAKAIGTVTKNIVSMNKALTATQKSDALNNLRKDIEEVNKELNLPPELFNKMQTAIDSTDPTKIEAVGKEIINWIAQNDDLGGRSIPELAASLDAVEQEAYQSIDGIITKINVLGNTVDMNAQQLDNWNNWLAQSIFNFGENAVKGIQLVADDGSIITAYSIQDINMLAEAGILSENNFAMQAAKLLATYSATAAGIIRQNLGSLLAGLPLMPAMTFPAADGGGGGGDNPNKAEIDALDEKIKAHQEEIKAIQEKIKAFKEYIDIQKESLKRAKDEEDFIESLSEKHKELAKTKARIALLSLDDSEEAQAELINLQEDSAKQEEDITKETEDRKYDLQIQALDDAMKAFENAQQAIIDGIEDEIKEWEKLKEELSKVEGGGGGGGGGGSFGGLEKAAKDFELAVKDAMIDVYEKFAGLIEKAGLSQEAIEGIVRATIKGGGDMVDVFGNVQKAIDATIRRMETLKAANQDWGGSTDDDYSGGGGGTGAAQDDGETYNGASHFGGLIEEHHKGNFAGNLMSNEVFAKLLRGEYVATEGQMNNFMKNILPKIATNIAMNGNFPPALNGSGGTPNTNFEININVAGSLDKSVLPDIKKTMIKELNKILQMRGIKRSANNFTV
jgi:TP901 family phage tail tape measure protein